MSATDREGGCGLPYALPHGRACGHGQRERMLAGSRELIMPGQTRIRELEAENQQLKAQLAALQEQQSADLVQLRLLTDAVPGLIAYVDREERYRFVNAGYEAW